MDDLDTVSDNSISIVTPVIDNQAVIAGFRSQITALNTPDNARFMQLIAGYDTPKINAVARDAKRVQDQHIPDSNGLASLTAYRADLEDYYEGLIDKQWIEEGVSNGQYVPAYNLAVLPTGSGGRYVKTQTRVNIVLEMLVGDQEIIATTAEFEI